MVYSLTVENSKGNCCTARIIGFSCNYISFTLNHRIIFIAKVVMAL